MAETNSTALTDAFGLDTSPTKRTDYLVLMRERLLDGDWTEIDEGDLPWDQVQKALADIGFAGWAAAEVGGGGVPRLTKVRQQMQKAFGLQPS